MGPTKGSKLSPAKIRSKPDKVFGEGRPLPQIKLPFYSEIGSALIYYAEAARMKRNLKDFKDCDEVTDEVTKAVIEVYEKAGIPTISKKKVKQKVKDLWRLRREVIMLKQIGQLDVRKRKKKNGKREQSFAEIAGKLFEVKDNSQLSEGAKIFLEAQREPGRKGNIGDPIVVDSKKIQEKKKKAETVVNERNKKMKKKSDVECKMLLKQVMFESTEDEDDEHSDEVEEFMVKIDNLEVRENSKRKNELKMKIGETVDRFRISNDAAAHLANDMKSVES